MTTNYNKIYCENTKYVVGDKFKAQSWHEMAIRTFDGLTIKRIYKDWYATVLEFDFEEWVEARKQPIKHTVQKRSKLFKFL